MGKMERDCIAVFDLGKTNQKILIYDNRLNLIDSSYEAFDDYEEDGVQCEDVAQIAKWLKSTLKGMARRHGIGAISITSHGAACVFTDERGETTVPVVSYTFEPGEQFHQQFTREFGNAKSLQRETATPDYPGLGCLGKGIYFAKQKYAGGFGRTQSILNLPQYYGFLLTGQKGSEPTYSGCTSFLWDFNAMGWSSMVDKLGIRDKLPSRISRPWDVLGTLSAEISEETGLPESTLVTLGIHDSNAALLPYLIQMEEPFVLNSTGTFCVAMHPTDRVYFNDDELGKFVFYNIDAFNHPVKTALFLGGMEHDIYTGVLSGIHGQQALPAFNSDLYESILTERKLFIIPGGVIGGGMFPNSEARVVEKGESYSFDEIMGGGRRPEFFNDFERSYAVLNLSLAIETQVALKRINHESGEAIFTEGGFRNNDSYNILLSAMNPESKIFLSNLDEATAFGAALLGKCALERKTPNDMKDHFKIETQEVAYQKLSRIEDYIETFLRYTENSTAAG